MQMMLLFATRLTELAHLLFASRSTGEWHTVFPEVHRSGVIFRQPCDKSLV
jgi:hypothetical protein